MLNKKYNENDVRQLFSGHGTIEECTVLRDTSGQSKGCAFVTFSTKQSAIGAIKVSFSQQSCPINLSLINPILNYMIGPPSESNNGRVFGAACCKVC